MELTWKGRVTLNVKLEVVNKKIFDLVINITLGYTK